MNLEKTIENVYDRAFDNGNKFKLMQLELFQTAFNSTFNTEPTLLDTDNWYLRNDLMLEEVKEYADACIDENKVEILDALVDQMYILCGTIVSHGMQHIFNEAFNRVHDNNMSKLVDGKPLINELGAEHYDPTRPIGKVLKPKGYVPVDLTYLIK
jgi:predicted HAD superfamily Cof-like phosphohydrolase